MYNDIAGSFSKPIFPNARRRVTLGLFAVTALAIVLLYFVAQAYFKSIDIEAAQTRLQLYERSLNETLSRHQHLPFILAQDRLVKTALEGENNEPLNKRLETFAQQADLEAIYLMDVNGYVLASSNYNLPSSFMNKNYAFRPYFKQSLTGSRGNYFGIGATTGRPGYFVSEPVITETGKTAGVMAIKLDASELQQSWEQKEEIVFAVDRNNIVVLASNPEWLYNSIASLPDDVYSEIINSRQFGKQEINALDWSDQTVNSVTFEGTKYSLASVEADHLGWKVFYLSKNTQAHERALLATIIFGSAISVLVSFAAFMRSRRIQAALQTSQKDREQLLMANNQLQEAQSELARSGKLAALGQLSASVVHELGQPVSALKNYVAAEEMMLHEPTNPVFKKISKVVERIENITQQLRFFTKSGEQKLEPVNMQDVISDCIELLQHDLELADVKINYRPPDNDVFVIGNKLRLEQVLVNILNNSLSSLAEAKASSLSISLNEDNNLAYLNVEDNGTGFGDRKLEQLQEPFHTTKASGDGMGLGLSIATEIIAEHNGELQAENLKNSGARFSIILPLAVIEETYKDE